MAGEKLAASLVLQDFLNQPRPFKREINGSAAAQTVSPFFHKKPSGREAVRWAFCSQQRVFPGYHSKRFSA
jgi:hypothetical protein